MKLAVTIEVPDRLFPAFDKCAAVLGMETDIHSKLVSDAVCFALSRVAAGIPLTSSLFDSLGRECAFGAEFKRRSDIIMMRLDQAVADAQTIHAAVGMKVSSLNFKAPNGGPIAR